MANLTIDADDVRLVEGGDEHQLTLPAGEAIEAGQYVRLHPSTGKFVLGNASSAAEVGDGYIAGNDAAIGEPVTAYKAPCVLNVGTALSGLDFGDSVYVSDIDGTLADAAGTVSTVAGTVVPAWATTSAEKLLRVDL